MPWPTSSACGVKPMSSVSRSRSAGSSPCAISIFARLTATPRSRWLCSYWSSAVSDAGAIKSSTASPSCSMASRASSAVRPISSVAVASSCRTGTPTARAPRATPMAPMPTDTPEVASATSSRSPATPPNAADARPRTALVCSSKLRSISRAARFASRSASRAALLCARAICFAASSLARAAR